MIRDAEVSSVVDTRLTASQLSGFARKKDFSFLVETILGIPCIDGTCLAPTKQILDDYKSGQLSWAKYEEKYLQILEERKQEILSASTSWGADPVLICSENSPDHCHRRLAAEFLIRQGVYPTVEHLIGDHQA